MQSINKAVENIVTHSDVPYFALQDGILNLSAYAKLIRKQVQNECKKPVKSINAIVMALSRMQKRVSKKKVKLPKISVSGVTIKRNLSELSIARSLESCELVQNLMRTKAPTVQVHLVTYGLNYINLIVQNISEKEIKKTFGAFSPTAIITDLVSITMSIPEDDVMTPNIFYTILSRFASQEINVIEITTAKLEQTIIIEEKLLPKAYTALSDILEEKEKLF